jgi:hypothetical protein
MSYKRGWPLSGPCLPSHSKRLGKGGKIVEARAERKSDDAKPHQAEHLGMEELVFGTCPC